MNSFPFMKIKMIQKTRIKNIVFKKFKMTNMCVSSHSRLNPGLRTSGAAKKVTAVSSLQDSVPDPY